jgi:hypothetical protein
MFSQPVFSIGNHPSSDIQLIVVLSVKVDDSAQHAMLTKPAHAKKGTEI